jgi:ubiquinone biosynthesis accessory factor UbiK
MEDTLKRIAASLPEGLEQLANDLRKNVHSAVGALARRADLVTREEFEVQTAVLARTRERLEALESRVAALEALLNPVSGKPVTPG